MCVLSRLADAITALHRAIAGTGSGTLAAANFADSVIAIRSELTAARA